MIREGDLSILNAKTIEVIIDECRVSAILRLVKESCDTVPHKETHRAVCRSLYHVSYSDDCQMYRFSTGYLIR